MGKEYKAILMRYRIDTERVDLFDVNIIITMKVFLDKAIDFDAAKAAFTKACSFHEVLNSRVVIEDSGEACYVDNDDPHNSINMTDLDLEELINENETFMKCLAGQECESAPFRSLGLSDLPAESKLPFYYKLLADSWNKKWKKERKVFGFDDMDNAYSGFWKDRKTEIELKRYSKEELGNMPVL